MKNEFISKKNFLILIPILSLYLGFFFDEDLSTGGSKLDFYQTFPAVIDFSNWIYNQSYLYTRHFPFHYIILSIPHILINDIFLLRLIYLSFSLLLPLFLYLNLCQIYKEQKINNLIISFTILFLPFVRASAIWPNAHLTAVIFLLIANYFFLINITSSKKKFQFFNILFLSLATYCVQSYAILFLFYLFKYYKGLSKLNFLKIVFFCILFSIPGFYLVVSSPIVTKLAFTKNISYTVITNLSITFFFLCFFLSNKKNLLKVKNLLLLIKPIEIILMLLTFCILLITYKKNLVLTGGGFFYKISFFIFKNDILFLLTSFFGLIFIYIIYKNFKELFSVILLINLTSIAYYSSQKYFEPLLLVCILALTNNFLTKNVLNNHKYSLAFYFLTLCYFFIAIINNSYGFSKILN
tara:strand:- start:814 stop:2043 length:1230 start_codon:yes stop_codon:yes gene_type:complete